jgi:putative endonuclease
MSEKKVNEIIEMIYDDKRVFVEIGLICKNNTFITPVPMALVYLSGLIINLSENKIMKDRSGPTRSITDDEADAFRACSHEHKLLRLNVLDEETGEIKFAPGRHSFALVPLDKYERYYEYFVEHAPEMEDYEIDNEILFKYKVFEKCEQENQKNWFVYIVRCSDGSLYTGASTNVEKRVETHNKGKGAKYTRARLPVVLEAHVGNLTKSEALSLEYKVKQQKKKNKVQFLKDTENNNEQ